MRFLHHQEIKVNFACNLNVNHQIISQNTTLTLESCGAGNKARFWDPHPDNYIHHRNFARQVPCRYVCITGITTYRFSSAVCIVSSKNAKIKTSSSIALHYDDSIVWVFDGCWWRHRASHIWTTLLNECSPSSYFFWNNNFHDWFQR